MDTEYYYIDDDGKQFGPYTLEMFRLLPLHRSTYVWHTGLSDWIHAGDLEELRGHLSERRREEVPPTPMGSDESTVPERAIDQSGTAMRHGDQPMPKTWLMESILVTLFCSLIGLVPFFHSMQVRNRYNMGDYEGAERESQLASRWLIITLVVGLVINLVYLFVFRDDLQSLLP